MREDTRTCLMPSAFRAVYGVELFLHLCRVIREQRAISVHSPERSNSKHQFPELQEGSCRFKVGACDCDEASDELLLTSFLG